MEKNYYEQLGISRDASPEEIKKSLVERKLNFLFINQKFIFR